MAVTVSLQGNATMQGNPYIADVGKRNSDAVVINSGFSGGRLVTYEIRRYDQAPWTMEGNITLSVLSTDNTNELIRAVSDRSLTIVLPMRQWFEARAHQAGSWTSWVRFKTRDKSYKSPDTFTETRVVTSDNATGERVVVTNAGRCTETTTATGVQIVNNDTGCNEVVSENKTGSGVTIHTRTVVTATSNGARVETS